MKVEFAKDEICDGVNSPYWIVMTVPIPKSEKAATALAAELNAREEKLAEAEEDKRQHFQVVENFKVMLERQASSCREEIASLTAERDRLRAYAECAEAWESDDGTADWVDLLSRHGWEMDRLCASQFIKQLRTAALATPAKPSEPSDKPC